MGANCGCGNPMPANQRPMTATEVNQCAPAPTPSRQLLISLRNKLADIRNMSGELLTRVAGPEPSKDQCGAAATPMAVMIDLEILDREASYILEQIGRLLNLI